MEYFGNSKWISTHENRKEYAKEEYTVALGENKQACDVSIWDVVNYLQKENHI